MLPAEEISHVLFYKLVRCIQYATDGENNLSADAFRKYAVSVASVTIEYRVSAKSVIEHFN